MATLPHRVDAVDVHEDSIVVALSALEGNTWDGGLGLMSASTGEFHGYFPLPTGSATVRFLGGGEIVGAGCDDGTLRLFSAGAQLELQLVVSAHFDILSGLAAIPGSFGAITCGWDQDIKIWDLHSAKDAVATIRSAHCGPINAVAVNPHQTHDFASVGVDGMVRLWDSRDVKSSNCSMMYMHDCPVSCVEWDATCAHQLFTGTDAGDLHAFDLRKLDQCVKMNVHGGRLRAIKSSRFYKDIVCTCSDDASVAVISPAQRKVLHSVTVHEDYATDIAILPPSGEEGDQRVITVCSGSSDKTVKLSEIVI